MLRPNKISKSVSPLEDNSPSTEMLEGVKMNLSLLADVLKLEKRPELGSKCSRIVHALEKSKCTYMSSLYMAEYIGTLFLASRCSSCRYG